MEKITTLSLQLSHWVKEARLFAGFSQEKLGDIIGRTKQNVWNIENGKHEPSYSQLMLIARETKYPKPFPGLEKTVDFAPDGYMYLDFYDIQSSAGDGSSVTYEPEIRQLLVLKDWVTEHLGYNAETKTKIITNKGVSMHPTINDGDLLFIDITVTQYDGDGIYIISDDGELRTKRLIKEDGMLRIVSDNPSPAYKEKVINARNQDTLVICGRVRHYFALKNAV